MTISITSALNDARLTGTLAFLDTGSSSAAVRIYGSTRPATPADTPGSVMLVQIDLTKPAGSVSAGVLTLTPAANGLIAETGTATWARIVNGDGATAFDCDAGQGSGAWEIELVEAVLYAGGDAALQSATLG